MNIDDRVITDGQVTVTGGVSSLLDSDVLEPNNVAWMSNCTTDSGKPRNRKYFREVGTLPGGIYNGIGYYSKGNGSFVCCVNGEPYQLNYKSGKIRYRKYGFKIRNNRNTKVTFAETPDSLLVLDGVSRPYVIDGSECRRAGIDEVPPGRIAAYGNGRLWVARGNIVFPGDLIQYNKRQSELQFTEINFLSGGGAFRMPSEVTGMSFIPVSDSATGFGSLIVFGKDWTVAIRAEVIDRTAWQTTSGFVTSVFPNIGCVGHKTIVQVNQDLYWRDQYGQLRSFRQAVLDYQTAGSVPLSTEISRLLENESVTFNRFASSVSFDNRLIGTVSPALGAYGEPEFQKLFSLDFSPIARMGSKSNPVFEGSWQGLNVLDLVTGVVDGTPRCLLVTRSDDNNLKLYEYTEEGVGDTYIDLGVTKSISPTSYIEYRKFDFQNRFVLKKLMRFDVYLSELSGDTTIKMHYRVDGEHAWTLLDQYDITIQENNFRVNGGETAFFRDKAGVIVLDPLTQNPLSSSYEKGTELPSFFAPQYRVALKSRSPEHLVSGQSRKAGFVGYQFQFMVEITGPTWKIDRVLALTAPIKDSPFALDTNWDDDLAIDLDNHPVAEYSIPSGAKSTFYTGSDDTEYENEELGILYHKDSGIYSGAEQAPPILLDRIL